MEPSSASTVVLGYVFQAAWLKEMSPATSFCREPKEKKTKTMKIANNHLHLDHSTTILEPLDFHHGLLILDLSELERSFHKQITNPKANQNPSPSEDVARCCMIFASSHSRTKLPLRCQQVHVVTCGIEMCGKNARP